MVVSEFFVYFIIYSFLGWIYETCYCTIVEKSWQNRGFLYGPVVPMYGLAAVACHIIFIRLPYESLHNMKWYYLFLICAAGSFVMEYVTSFILEKKFHARWWDYSNIPLNINGRVALPFTFCFGCAGVVIVNYLLPFVNRLNSCVHPLVFEILGLALMLIFGMDLALTISNLTSFAKEFERINDSINLQMSERIESIGNTVVETKESISEVKENIELSLLERKEAKALKREQNEERYEELREQISIEAIKKYLANASESQKGQLRHIVSFRHPVASTKKLMEKGSAILKKKISK